MPPKRAVEARRSERRRFLTNQLCIPLLAESAGISFPATLFALLAAIAPAAYAAITPTGDFTPNPLPAVVSGDVIIGNTGTGTLSVDTGSTLTANGLVGASNAAANGTISIIGTTSGPQTTLNLLGPATTTAVDSPLQLGRWGVASLTVSNGAIMNAGMSGGTASANCLQQ